MSDPAKLDFSDWLQVAVGSMVSGIAAAMAWFSGEKRVMHDRMDKMEGAMRCWDESQSDHKTQLAVLETCQRNTEERLDELTDLGKTINGKLDALIMSHGNNNRRS